MVFVFLVLPFVQLQSLFDDFRQSKTHNQIWSALNLIRLVQRTRARDPRQSLRLSKGVFTPASHPPPALRPPAPLLFAQLPCITITASLFHPRPKPLHALGGSDFARPAILFIFPCPRVRLGSRSGHPRYPHGPVALAEYVLLHVGTALRPFMSMSGRCGSTMAEGSVSAGRTVGRGRGRLGLEGDEAHAGVR